MIKVLAVACFIGSEIMIVKTYQFSWIILSKGKGAMRLTLWEEQKKTHGLEFA